MSREFAEKIIDSMVDENGHCGERGLSGKQFYIISECLEETGEREAGGWSGDYSYIQFWSRDYEGNIGKYHVVANMLKHFNVRYTIKSIELRDPEEYRAELDKEAEAKALRDFSGSEWVAEPGKRIDMALTLVSDYEYVCEPLNYYDDGSRHIYTLRDGDGNCVVWKTSKPLGMWREANGREEWVAADEAGDTVRMRATVKEHSTYRGTKQTVIARPKVEAIEKA